MTEWEEKLGEKDLLVLKLPGLADENAILWAIAERKHSVTTSLILDSGGYSG